VIHLSRKRNNVIVGRLDEREIRLLQATISNSPTLEQYLIAEIMSGFEKT
jgi:hypothetical protein